MENGAEISNVNGRAVYADSGTVTIGGKISGIKSNNKMWQGTSGTALHLRNNATGTLTATGLIANVTGGGSIVNLSGSTYTMDAGSVMSGNQGNNIAAYGGANTIYMNGEITGIRSGNGNGNYDAINLQAASAAKDLIYCKIGATGNIHDNNVWYGSVYVQGNNIELHHYGKINNNCSSDKSGGIVLANNMTGAKVFMYDGAEVIGNKSDNDSAGVMVSCGTFTMNGGKISGNIAKGQAGGVYVRRGGQFIMNGGEISNNHAKKYGGGVSFVASDYSGYVPYVALNGGTISGNTMGDSDPKVSNDLGIASSDYSHINRYLFLSDDVTIGDRAVYFEKDTKTVTLASDSLDIKLGNAGTEAVNALKTASATKGWDSPLATFWAQRTGAVTLTVGGLTPNADLPVYVLTIPVGKDGNPAEGAAANCYAAAVTTDGVKFTVPAANLAGNGCAIAIVQPTDDYGTLTIRGPETIKQTLTDKKYPVSYTVIYTVSDNMQNILKISGSTPIYSLSLLPDANLTGTVNTSSFTGDTITVEYTLESDTFDTVKTIFSSALLTITLNGNSYVILSNVAETQLIRLLTVTFDANSGAFTDTSTTQKVWTESGSTVSFPANPTRSGYTFTGWNTQQDGKGSSFDNRTVITGSLTVYAQWQKNSSDSDNSGSSGTPSGLNTKDHYSYIIGYQDGTLQPYGTITRGEVATIFFRLLTEETREANWSTTNNYADCSPDLWCNNAISTLTRMGIIEGFEDGTFRPNARITRAQFAKIAVGFFETTKEDYAGFFTDVNIGAWYTEYVEAAAHVGLIEGFGDGTFRPDTNITRAQACVIVNRALGRKPDEEHLLNDDEMLTWPDNNPDDWFYADMQEATNSHDYSWITVNDKDGGRVKIENWTEKLLQRDWIAFEHAWSTAYSAPGGEVTQ
ncbi:MAG: S-layer homology domain-containing protein [Oscillospiraceae bacterium]|nr:S-layer homology domain-containing protein [Oscillospiraceae bacterium]